MINTNFERDVRSLFVPILPLLKASIALPGTEDAEHYLPWINQLSYGMKAAVEDFCKTIDELLLSPGQKATFAHVIERSSQKDVSALIDYCHRCPLIYEFYRRNFAFGAQLQCSFDTYRTNSKREPEKMILGLVASLEALAPVSEKAAFLKRSTPIRFIISPNISHYPVEEGGLNDEEEPILRSKTPIKAQLKNHL